MCVIDDVINNTKEALNKLIATVPNKGIKNKAKWLINELTELQTYTNFVKQQGNNDAVESPDSSEVYNPINE